MNNIKLLFWRRASGVVRENYLANWSIAACRKRGYSSNAVRAGVEGDVSRGLSFDRYPSSGSKHTRPSIANSQAVVFLHGILGNKKNWRTPSNLFVKKHPNFEAVAIDHRGHGSSNSSRDKGIVVRGDNTVRSCALDVLDVITSLRIRPSILSGHSFSGKVVLSYLNHLIAGPDGAGTSGGSLLPQHIWILDSIPGIYNRSVDLSQGQQSVFNIMSLIASLPTEFESKEWMEQLLLSKGVSLPIAQWLTANVIPMDPSIDREADSKHTTSSYSSQVHGASKSHYQFAFDRETVFELFEDFCRLDLWDFLYDYHDYSSSRCPTMVHFVRAGKNVGWTSEVLGRFEELQRRDPRIVLHTMPHVGHWLHAEDVQGLLGIISSGSQLT